MNEHLKSSKEALRFHSKNVEETFMLYFALSCQIMWWQVTKTQTNFANKKNANKEKPQWKKKIYKALTMEAKGKTEKVI